MRPVNFLSANHLAGVCARDPDLFVTFCRLPFHVCHHSRSWSLFTILRGRACAPTCDSIASGVMSKFKLSSGVVLCQGTADFL